MVGNRISTRLRIKRFQVEVLGLNLKSVPCWLNKDRPVVSTRNIDEEFFAAKFEEDSIKQKLANYEMDGKNQR